MAGPSSGDAAQTPLQATLYAAQQIRYKSNELIIAQIVITCEPLRLMLRVE